MLPIYDSWVCTRSDYIKQEDLIPFENIVLETVSRMNVIVYYQNDVNVQWRKPLKSKCGRENSSNMIMDSIRLDKISNVVLEFVLRSKNTTSWKL